MHRGLTQGDRTAEWAGWVKGLIEAYRATGGPVEIPEGQVD